MTSDQRQALENFSAHLAPGARVLYAAARSAGTPAEAQSPLWLKSHGFVVDELDPSKDLRFLSLKRESYDAVWSGRAWVDYSIEDAQRIIALFFQALMPGTGVLFAAFLEENKSAAASTGPEFHRYDEVGFASMIRQNGFQTLLQGRQNQTDHENTALWCAVIARRI